MKTRNPFQCSKKLLRIRILFYHQ
uniref:Uncharacterized protein n=1 Tax=Tetranychus urticae TaxID=32264 RepID=T1KT45_TETUR